mmetsp:Transcript_14273/g.43857  ORF Transcript_14273/g.43857 Transcript_14273/m.43857 type:complete len:175 (+) Transcript_14273:188-712(+)
MSSNALLSDLNRARVERNNLLSAGNKPTACATQHVDPQELTRPDTAVRCVPGSSVVSQPPISAAEWAARPKRQPYRPPTLGQEASKSLTSRSAQPLPLKDEIFSRHLQYGIKQYRTVYDAHANAHLNALRDTAGSGIKSNAPVPLGSDSISMCAAKHATIDVGNITEYVHSAGS